MKRFPSLAVMIFFLILAGCSGGGRIESPMKDGLYFKYEVTSSGDMNIKYTATFTFKEISRGKFELIKEYGGPNADIARPYKKRPNDYVTSDFRCFDSPVQAYEPGPVGSPLWLPPERLKKNKKVAGFKVLEETTKNGYQVYRLRDLEVEGFAYYETTTGLQIADENLSGSIKLFARLIETNADGLQ